MAKPIIYTRLFNEMRRNKESQTKVAELLGVSLQSIGRKLTGTTEWTIGEIEELCKHYNKDYYELFGKE